MGCSSSQPFTVLPRNGQKFGKCTGETTTPWMYAKPVVADGQCGYICKLTMTCQGPQGAQEYAVIQWAITDIMGKNITTSKLALQQGNNLDKSFGTIIFTPGEFAPKEKEAIKLGDGSTANCKKYTIGTFTLWYLDDGTLKLPVKHVEATSGDTCVLQTLQPADVLINNYNIYKVQDLFNSNMNPAVAKQVQENVKGYVDQSTVKAYTYSWSGPHYVPGGNEKVVSLDIPEPHLISSKSQWKAAYPTFHEYKFFGRFGEFDQTPFVPPDL